MVVLDSYREEIVVRAGELLLRHARRMGKQVQLAAVWPEELRDLAHERGWHARPNLQLEELVAERAQLSAERAQHPMLARLARLGIPGSATQLLASCAIAQVDASLLRLWYELRPTPTVTGYCLGTWLELFPEHRAELYRALAPSAPLRRLHFLEVHARGPSLLTAEVEVPHHVVACLLGLAGRADEALPGALALASTLEPDALVRSTAVPLPVEPRVAFVGATGAGRTSNARLWAADRSESVVVLDLARVPSEHATRAVALALREAVLQDATPILRVDSLAPGTATDVFAELARFEAAFAVIAPPALSSTLTGDIADVAVLEVPKLSLGDQSQLWRRELEHRQIPPGDVPDQIVATYDMLPGNIVEVARRLRPDTSVDLATIRELVRSNTTAELWGLATRVTTSLTWHDVILPRATHDLLSEMLAHARYRATVFESWGYGRKINYGRALTALFYGPPGTGKTLAASLIALDLGRDLFRVDLSRIIDKYVGETEKNLDRIFKAATRAHAMLLFDEADSLFAKRTGVESANDRYANLAVNFLLQALEAFEGICILTTNMESSIDEAFKRRMRFRIEFPKPSVKDQAALWRSMITPQAQVAQDIPWLAVAEQFPEMTGGHIRSAVLRAAFLAVAEGGIIDLDRIRRAAFAEYEELGHIVTTSSRRSTL